MSTNTLSEYIRGPIELILREPEDSEQPLWKQLLEFAEKLNASGEEVTLRFERASENAGSNGEIPAPSLSIGNGRCRPRVHYRAVPEGLELAPFIELIRKLCPDEQDENRQNFVNSDDSPGALLEVVIAPTCPTCPSAVKVALDIASGSPDVDLFIIDGTKCTDVAKRYDIKSVPVTIINGELSLVGVVSRKDIDNARRGEGSEDSSRLVFRSLVRSGQHGEAAKLLSGTSGLVFTEWWSESTLTERIWLMLVAEESLERTTGSLDGLVDGLIELLDTENISLRGDTVDLLGRIGHPAARPGILRLCDDSNNDVAEVARDALEDLDEAHRAN
jgi:hypothetical protein